MILAVRVDGNVRGASGEGIFLVEVWERVGDEETEIGEEVVGGLEGDGVVVLIGVVIKEGVASISEGEEFAFVAAAAVSFGEGL